MNICLILGGYTKQFVSQAFSAKSNIWR